METLLVENSTSTEEYHVTTVGLQSLTFQLAVFVFFFWLGMKIWPAKKPN